MIDIAPACWRGQTDPCVLAVSASDRAVVAILEGRGDWGSGVEAANWTRASLGRRWERICPFDLSELTGDISEVVASIPTELRDPNDFGFGFSAAAAIVNANSIATAALGIYGILLVKPDRVEPLFEPITLAKQLAGTPGRTPEEIARAKDKYRNVCAGPFVSSSNPPIMCVFGPYKSEPGEKIVASYHLLQDHLVNCFPRDWQQLSARGLQAVGSECDSGCYPVFVVSANSA